MLGRNKRVMLIILWTPNKKDSIFFYGVELGILEKNVLLQHWQNRLLCYYWIRGFIVCKTESVKMRLVKHFAIITLHTLQSHSLLVSTVSKSLQRVVGGIVHSPSYLLVVTSRLVTTFIVNELQNKNHRFFILSPSSYANIYLQLA